MSETDDEPLRIWWNKNLHGKISPGKLAAHAAHAALHAYGIRYTHPIVVLAAGKGRIEAMEVVIRDEGRTELAPGTVTAGVERARAVLGDRDALREKIGVALYGENYRLAHAEPRIWGHLVEEFARKIDAVLDVLYGKEPQK